MTKHIKFSRRLSDGSVYHLGTAVERTDGWRFISNVASHGNSRKSHAMYVDCIPRWVGFPDKCESEFIGFEEENRAASNAHDASEAALHWFEDRGNTIDETLDAMAICMASLIKVIANRDGLREQDVYETVGGVIRNIINVMEEPEL